MFKHLQKYLRTPSFTLTFIVVFVLLVGATIVIGQGNLNGFSYLPIVLNDAPSGPDPTPPPGPTPTLPPPSSSDWAMVAANPQRTSWSPEEVSGNTQLQWYRPIEGYIPQNSQVIAAGGLLYISTSSGLLALHAATGDLVWRFDTELPLGNSPTYADGVIYVGGYDRKIHALNALTGAHLWAFSGAGAGYDTNPLVVDDKVFAGNRDGKMYAIGAHNTAQQGQLVWQHQTGGAIHFSAAYSNGRIYFAASDNFAYALDADSGQRVWRSDRLNGLQFHSWWPVVFRDMVIFPVSPAYRSGMSPGTRSVSDDSGTPFGLYRDIQLYDLFPDMVEGTLLGPEVGARPWANGYPVIDASRVTEYLEANPAVGAHVHKPWRRMMVALNVSDGSEFTFDSDQDGHPEYMPVTDWGAGSGNRYPAIVGPDNILYFSNLYQCCSDEKGRVMGWQPGEPSMLSVMGGLGAIAEPQAISAGGSVIYRNLCCDRVGDWFNMQQPGQTRQLWSYNLDELAPDYDQHTWTILPGWPRLKGWYTGDSDSNNAAYHNHGDQNPIVPYEGRLYVHRSNTIFAFGPGSGPGRLPLIEAAAPDVAGSSLTEQQLVARLQSEVQKMLDAGHLRPGYYNVAQFLGRGLEDYFDNPGDTIYTLARAYPHLPAAMQADVRNYLQSEFSTYFDPAMYASIGWADGAPREDMVMPPEVANALADFPARVGAGGGFGWQYPQHNFYAMWKYAEIFPGEASRVYDLAKSRLQVPLPSFPVPDYLAQQPYEHNAWIAGYIGFLELQELAGMTGADAQLRTQVTNELNSLMQLRVSLFTSDSYWLEDRFHKKHLDVARNFMYLVPELGDYMDQQLRSEVQAALVEYETVAPYWFVSRYESAIGEGVMSNLYNYNALFNARAYILNQPQSELTKYVDVPAFQRGDLFYIQNLVAAIEAP